MATRAAKRQKSIDASTATTTDDGVDLTLLRILVESVLHQLQLNDDAVTPLLATGSSLLRVRRVPPSAVSVCGVGAFTSDLAVRLFHVHSVRSSRHDSATSPGDHDPADETFKSSAALAAFCVAIMERTRSAHALRFASITSITLPTDAARAAGVLGDRVLIHTRQFARVRHVPTPLESRITVLFRDDAVLVVHKPHGMLSVDGNLLEEDDLTPALSVQSLVREYYPDARMVHRLDQETSGILAIALTRSAAQHLNQQFRDRMVNKTYMARVLGHVSSDNGVIDVRMAPHATKKLVQCVVDDEGDEAGASTRTEWRVLERSDTSTSTTADASDEAGSERSSLMELTPVTGKTHQLRVHMQHLGHPILGDSLYSPDRVHRLAPRLLLHAARLEFSHPITNKRVDVTCTCDF